MDTIPYTMACRRNTTTTVDAAQPVPGLFVFRLPDDHQPASPHRWRIGHHSGLAIAEALRHEDITKGAELLGPLADWTQAADTVREQLNPSTVYVKLALVDCIEPGSEPYADGVNVSSNGRYTDDDIRKAAAEAKADGFNAFDILISMTATVPWSGLDTEDFNEAHDRVVALANAA